MYFRPPTSLLTSIGEKEPKISTNTLIKPQSKQELFNCD